MIYLLVQFGKNGIYFFLMCKYIFSFPLKTQFPPGIDKYLYSFFRQRSVFG